MALAAAEAALRALEPPQKEFIASGNDYGSLAWAPGNISCWESASGLSFERCCGGDDAARQSCWSGLADLSFATCCGADALPRSTLPRVRRVVAMLSTTPYRVLELEQVLTSLAHQTHRLDATYLAIPFVFQRDWAWYNMPWWYNMMVPRLRVIRCEQDYRPISGLLCSLRHEPHPDTYILMVDDDVVYHPQLVEFLLKKSAQHPGAMIGSMCYHGEGIWCQKFDERGVCVDPNLSHKVYGVLVQRRFFDAGLFNFGAVAQAYARLRPNSPDVVTSCMIADNLWLAAHLARKGVPRVFLRTRVGALTIVDLAFGHGALNSGYQATYHFHGSDPHTIDEAEQLCKRALSALWGPSLWAVKGRRVAAAMLPPGDDPLRGLPKLADRLPWFAYEAAVVFSCSQMSLAQWRELILARGGRLRLQVAYLHAHVERAAARAPFVSEPLDASAITPEPLHLVTLPDGRRGFAPSAAIPGQELAGTVLPLLDVVELCPAPEEEVEVRTTTAECPAARVMRNACRVAGRPPRRLQSLEPGGFAAVRCCGGAARGCLPNWIWRNSTWLLQGYGSCLPTSATFLEALRSCAALDMRLCNASEVLDCCGMGCDINPVAWLASPTTADCVLAAAAAAKPLGSVGQTRSQPVPEQLWQQPERVLALQDAFLRYSEEARSTLVRWITPRLGE